MVCEPSCFSTTGTNRDNYFQSGSQAEYRAPANKKTVQYPDQRYDQYSIPQAQGNYKMQNVPSSFPPCYENIPQRPGMVGRQHETYRNAQTGGMQAAGAYDRRLNNLVGKHYNTLFVDKADENLEQSLKYLRPSANNSNAGQSSAQSHRIYQHQVKSPKEAKR